MRKGHTEVVFVMDRSGSMSSIQSDAIGGFNSVIKSQREDEGTSSISLVLFDDQYEVVYENVDINEVKELDNKTFVPRGMTALLDAIGKTINSVGDRLSKTEEDNRPEKVMLCIITDGQENQSREFTNEKIKEMIEHQRTKYNWEFSFLAANQDAFKTGGNLGISSAYTASFAANSVGTRTAYATMDSMVKYYKSL